MRLSCWFGVFRSIVQLILKKSVLQLTDAQLKSQRIVGKFIKAVPKKTGKLSFGGKDPPKSLAMVEETTTGTQLGSVAEVNVCDACMQL